jgi:hypothetical protein
MRVWSNMRILKKVKQQSARLPLHLGQNTQSPAGSGGALVQMGRAR